MAMNNICLEFIMGEKIPFIETKDKTCRCNSKNKIQENIKHYRKHLSKILNVKWKYMFLYKKI